MKLCIKKYKEIYRWDFGSYSARTAYDVQQRFLWFFWFTIKGFWDESLAREYMESKIEQHNSKAMILK